MIRMLLSWLRDLSVDRSMKRFAMARVVVRFNSYVSGYEFKPRDFKD
jgi:hypothetical protein